MTLNSLNLPEEPDLFLFEIRTAQELRGMIRTHTNRTASVALAALTQPMVASGASGLAHGKVLEYIQESRELAAMMAEHERSTAARIEALESEVVHLRTRQKQTYDRLRKTKTELENVVYDETTERKEDNDALDTRVSAMACLHNTAWLEYVADQSVVPWHYPSMCFTHLGHPEEPLLVNSVNLKTADTQPRGSTALCPTTLPALRLLCSSGVLRCCTLVLVIPRLAAQVERNVSV